MPIDLVKKHLTWFLATLNDFFLVKNEIDVCSFANDMCVTKTLQNY